MTKAEALREFRETHLPYIRKEYESDGRVDSIARCEAWNDFVDYLRTNKRITQKQYDTWNNPF